MSENENKHNSQNCCCCQSWKAIFIAIGFLAIGAFIGHKMTMMCHYIGMRGPCGGGYGREICRDRDGRECKGGFERKADMRKCRPGCTCPMCSKRAACSSEKNKAGAANTKTTKEVMVEEKTYNCLCTKCNNNWTIAGKPAKCPSCGSKQITYSKSE